MHSACGEEDYKARGLVKEFTPIPLSVYSLASTPSQIKNLRSIQRSLVNMPALQANEDHLKNIFS